MKTIILITVLILLVTITQSQQQSNAKLTGSAGTLSKSRNTQDLSMRGASNYVGNWADEVGNSIYECLLGIFLFVFAAQLLWFNERRAVNTDLFLEKGYQECETIDVNKVEEEYEGDLVHAVGRTKVSGELVDHDTGVKQKCIRLIRHAERYCKLVSKDDKGKETVYYRWTNSNDLVQDFNETSDHVQVGVFHINDEQIDQMGTGRANLSSYKIQISKQLKSKADQLKLNMTHDNDYLWFKQGSKDVEEVEGDHRISYSIIPEGGDITILAKQHMHSFVAYNVSESKNAQALDLENQPLNGKKKKPAFESNGGDLSIPCITFCCVGAKIADRICKAPKTYNHVFEDKLDLIGVFQQLADNAATRTTLYRLGGYCLMVLGVYLFFAPLYTILSVLPIAGTIGEWIALLVGVLIAFPVSTTVIALAWVRYRPATGIRLLALATVLWIVAYQVVETGDSKQVQKRQKHTENVVVPVPADQDAPQDEGQEGEIGTDEEQEEEPGFFL